MLADERALSESICMLLIFKSPKITNISTK